MHRHRLVGFALIVVSASFCGLATAQIPDGWIVVGSFRTPSTLGNSGIYFAPPLGGIPQIVTGLPPIIAGTLNPGVAEEGIDLILRRPSDGALIVSAWGAIGVQLQMHILTLSGTAVVGTSAYNLGLLLPQTTLGAPEAAFLPNEEILIAMDNVGQPGVSFVRVNSFLGPPGTPGTVVPISVSPQPVGRVNAMTLDPTGTIAYLGMIGTNVTSIYSLSLANPVLTPVFLTSFPGHVRNLEMGNGGALIAAGATQALISINPSTGAQTPITNSPANLNALAIERATGDYIVAQYTLGLGINTLWRVPVGGGSPSVLSANPLGGWGSISGLDLNPNPEPYGAPTSTALGASSWLLTPNPGGLPSVGNSSFSLTVNSTPGNLPGLYAISFAPLLPPQFVAGFLLHVDLNSLLSLTPLVGMPVETIYIPIPPAPSLSGVQGFFEAVHFDGSGVTSATTGLHLTIL